MRACVAGGERLTRLASSALLRRPSSCKICRMSLSVESSIVIYEGYSIIYGESQLMFGDMLKSRNICKGKRDSRVDNTRLVRWKGWKPKKDRLYPALVYLALGD